MRQGNTQRIGYFDGQLLTARDLEDDAAFESRFRQLHVRALHNTWGVALGYAVKRVASNLVEVGPGIAYDCRGREIISARTLNVGPPPAPAQSQAGSWYFDLALRARKREADESGQVQACLGGAFNPREERPAWRWRFAGDASSAEGVPPAQAEAMRLGDEIPLARFVVTQEGTIGAPDFSVRRNAQGLVRPHVAGAQVEGQLAFTASQAAYSLTVDTAAAGFSQTPYYFARLTLPRLLDAAAEDAEIAALLQGLLGPFVTVRNPQRTSFQLDVRFAGRAPGAATGTAPPADVAAMLAGALEEDASLLTATVNWAGIEPNGGCAPPIETAFLFLLFQPVIVSTGFILGDFA